MAADRYGRDALEAAVVAAGAQVLGANAPRLPQTSCFAAPGYASELQVISLDLAGVQVSAGAACSSGKVKASPVVAAMGRPDLAAFSIRVSGGWATTGVDWAHCATAWVNLNERRTKRRLEVA
jgi:cysteine desulfurase